MDAGLGGVTHWVLAIIQSMCRIALNCHSGIADRMGRINLA